MKKVLLLVAVAGATGWAAYAYRDRLLAGMLGLMGRLQALGGDPMEDDEVDVAGSSIHFPRQEEDLSAR